ncbi:phage tail spike protein [Staphylococcus delphini]|uniref:phage tail spike protein n=1 Tax=Staphylococcus delphini TaxID=53344 RepID=UPI0033650268
MIHVMNFKGEIVDFISHSDNAVIQAVHNRNINERMETFDFTILSERTTHLQERNRIIIQDKNGQYREFIIDRISADIDGYTEVETVASYLEDITKARPYAPGKLEKMTTKQALSDVLKDAGWEVSDATEYGGIRTTSWTSYQTRYDVLLQLCTTYDMMADFYIEVGSNRVDKRLVVLRKRNPLFKGKEIEYGKDLIGLKRTVDFSEIKTALLCVGPEPEEGKKRLELVVKDDEAQAKYGLPGRYNWGVYEPESSEQNMSESRLRTLGTTELNKRKSEVITYEVTAVDIEKEFKHEIVNLGDKVRIKDREFTPPLYVEAEVISEEYDLIGEDATYTFGEYKEFKESDLRSPFDKKLDAIRQKLSDGLSNVNTIVKESLEGELQYFERKILKGDTPPDNPVNDLLWLDTSNPKVAVLRRYWNGEWIKSSAENAGDVGAVTREQALYSELSNTFVNLTIQHSRLIHDASEALESEYLVDTDIKANVSSKLNDTIGVFNQIKQNLDSMTSETATIGKLVDTQALYNTIENAKIAIDERFKLLQSQYTDEKFNEALNNVASKLGLTVNEDNQLVGEVDVSKQINEAVREMTNEMLRDYVTSTEYQSDKNGIIERLDNSDSERKQLSNQIADRVTRSEYENDVEQRLVNSKAEVLIEAEQTSNRVSKEVFNENSKTLERYTSEFINNVSTGMSFNYDDNGNIQSANVGPDGIKLKGDRVDITVNKDFNVLVNDVANKADETNIVNKINLSREGLEIDVNNVGIRGGDNSEYVHIKNDEITLYGTYTRDWVGATETNNVFTRLKNGHIRFRNNDKDRSIYISDLGISTFLDGSPTEASGTIQFFDHLYDPNIRGLTIRSGAGVLGLRSEGNKIVMEADDTVNIGSNKYSIYLRPFANTRSGINEFQFYVKDNTDPKDTDGVLLFGELSDPSRVAGSGIRFRKQGVRGHENISEMEPLVYATNNNGDIGSGSFHANNLYGDLKTKNTNVYALTNNGELRITDLNGYNNGRPVYNDLRAREIKTTEGGAFSNHSGKNVYFGVGYHELRITANDFYNGGNTKYQDVRANTFYGKSASNSSEKYKTNIKKWIVDASKLLKDTVFYEYNYKSDLEKGSKQKSHGIIIEREMPDFISRDADSIDLYEFITMIGKALQEQIKRNDELEFEYENIMRILEEYINGESQKDR